MAPARDPFEYHTLPEFICVHITECLWKQASYQNHEGVARLLLSLGADINAADYDGLTPLHWAALKVSTYNLNVDICNVLF